MKHARPTGRHRAQVRPRYGRIAVLASALTVTAVALAGGLGLLPDGADRSAAASSTHATDPVAKAPDTSEDTTGGTSEKTPADTSSERELRAMDGAVSGDLADGASPIAAIADSTHLPEDSGEGRRVVFSESRQRVWLVGDKGTVQRTYLVSGSVYDNLEPGTYAVYSRSRHAIGIDDSGTMEYFVRFTQGTQGAAIGFHTIPVSDGKPLQRISQLGTPLSHGCIRQARPNAVALWNFAPVGTTVVVTA